LEDDKFHRIEGFGVDRVFKGWAKKGLTDQEIFPKGSSASRGCTQSSKIMKSLSKSQALESAAPEGARHPIIIGAALIGFFGGKWQRDKFFVIRGHGKSSAESVLDDASAVPDHAKPSWPRALRFALVWLISWSAPVLLLSLWLGSGHTVVQEGHPKIVAAMNPCWIAGDACCIPPKAETITTAIGTLLIKFVPTAAPTIPTITAPKLESPERWISPVSSIARTTINIPAIKPKMDQEDPEETTDAETSTGREGIAK
jgi:hypothetical protein